MLKTIPWRMAVLGCALGILAGLMAVAFELDFPGKICEYNQATKHEECTTYSLFPFLLIKVFDTLNYYGVAITAVATVAIGIFTLTLKLSTDRLWDAGVKQRKLSEETATRQLRAYVHVDNPTILHTNLQANPDLCPEIRIQFQNYGQTPAYNVRNRCRCGLSLITDFDSLPDTIARCSDLGPTQDRTTILTIARNEWGLGKHKTFSVFGEITYFDAFQNRTSAKPRFTRYCYRWDDTTEDGLIMCDEGNESN